MTHAIAGRTWDVIVIGAGPAGAVASLCAARSGASVLLVERKRFPRAKVCGGCLNASALGLLQSLGLGGIAADFGLPVNQLHLGLRGRTACLALPAGVAISRAHFDSELVRHAVDAGATFLPESTATLGEVSESTREVIITAHGKDYKITSRVIVIAAGLGGSALGGELAFTTRVARNSRIGVGCMVDCDGNAYGQGRISMAISRNGYVGLTPTIEGLSIAAAIAPAFLKSMGSPARAGSAILEEAGFPPVPAMDSAEWSGTLPLTRKTRPVALPRVFLIGDAAGYIEPFTGQGMAIALLGAVALAPHVLRAIEGWSSQIARAWSREYARNVGSRHWPATLVAAITRQPRLANLAFALVGAAPAVPRALVRIVNRPFLFHTSS